MLPRYGSAKINLLMTDIDSFLCEIHDTKTDLYMDMKGKTLCIGLIPPAIFKVISYIQN